MMYLSLLQRIAGILAMALWLFVPLPAGNSHATEIGDLDLVAQVVDATDDSDSEDSDSDSADSDSEDSDSEDSDSEDSDSGDSDAEEDSDSNEAAAA